MSANPYYEMTTRTAENRLLAKLDTELPPRVAAERANLLFVAGSCAHTARPLAALEITVDGRANPVIAHSIPRPDRAAAGDGAGYRSGFWGIAALPASPSERSVTVELTATLDDGSRVAEQVGTIALGTAASARGASSPGAGAAPAIAICMATYEPPPELLERQLESIREQTNGDWVCLISDDHSSPESFAMLESMVGDDPRFVISRGESRVGFFHNFERALRLVPPGVEFVALADQDDRWDPDKLDVLLAAIGPASLAYSDARVVSADGELLSPTYWSRRRNNHTDLVSLTLANTVSGSAALFRRRVVDRALPFPPAIGGFYHDHWLALVGLATGSIAYVDRPLYDYVQHEDAVLGHERSQAWGLEGRGLRPRLAHFQADPQYFYEHWRTTYFREYCRGALMARLLEMRCGGQLSNRRRRALARLTDPERSPAAICWLALRQLRRLAGRNETVGAEGRLLRAFAWRRLLAGQPRSRFAAHRWLPRDGAFPVGGLATAESPVAAPTP